MERESSVKSLKTTPFERKTFEENFWVKEPGPDQPHIIIKQQSKTEEDNILVRFQGAGTELDKKRCTLGPGELRRTATEVR